MAQLLLQAVGFKRERDPGSAEFYYYLKWPKGKSPNEKMIAAIDSTNNTVSPALDNALKTLRGFRTEVETEIKHLNGGMATVSEAISALHTKTADWEQTSDALKLALQYIGIFKILMTRVVGAFVVSIQYFNVELDASVTKYLA